MRPIHGIILRSRVERIVSKDDLNYQLLKQITAEPTASQRSLAHRTGVSVGKVNYCIQALVDKGWIKVDNFRRSDHKWAYSYLLTPSGIRAKMKLARSFLARKELEYETLQREIHTLRQELATKGETEVALAEPTDSRSKGD